MNAYLATGLLAVMMGALTPNSVYNTSEWAAGERNPLTIVHASDLHYAPAGVQNRDEAPVGSGATDPNDRLVAAIRAIPGTRHPDGSTIRPVDYTILTGDLIHEATESTSRLVRDFPDAYLVDGNHDQAATRALIRARHGSLAWGAKLGRVWFQALTENYASAVSNTPPTATQINAVAASIASRGATEPTIFVVHRSMMSGYAAEWERTATTTITEGLDNSETGVDVASVAGLTIGDYVHVDTEEMRITDIAGLTLTVTRGAAGIAAAHTTGASVYKTTALDAFKTLCAAHNTICVLNGHDHYARHETWRGIRVFSPGSVTQAPMSAGPYSSIYPEAFNVIRIGSGWMDVANYNFGYNASRVWAPGTWNWSERLEFSI